MSRFAGTASIPHDAAAPDGDDARHLRRDQDLRRLEPRVEQQRLAGRVTLDRPAGGQVVLHDDATWSEQVDNLVVADAAVREHRVERRALRQVVAPIAFEHLRLRAGQRFARLRGALGVELDGDERRAAGSAATIAFAPSP